MAVRSIARWQALVAAAMMAGALAAPAAGVERAASRAQDPVVEIVDLGVAAPEAWVKGLTDSGVVVGEFRTGGSDVDRIITGFRWEDGTAILLDGLGGDQSFIRGVNAAGQAVGIGLTADGESHAVLWNTDGTVVDLGTPGLTSFANAINRRGVVVGAAQTDPADPTVHAVAWHDGRMTVLDDPRGLGGFAAAINDRGQIVGVSGHGEEGRARAVFWDRGEASVLELPDGGATVASDLNHRGEAVVSRLTDGSARRILFWDGDREPRELVLPQDFFPRGVTDRGQVIGVHEVRRDSAIIRSSAVRLERDGHLTELGTLGGYGSSPTAFNQRGEVVGHDVGPDGSRHSVLWRDGEVIDLGTRLNTLTDSGPEAINRRGLIAGTIDRVDGLTHPVLWIVHR